MIGEFFFFNCGKDTKHEIYSSKKPKQVALPYRRLGTSMSVCPPAPDELYNTQTAPERADTSGSLRSYSQMLPASLPVRSY